MAGCPASHQHRTSMSKRDAEREAWLGQALNGHVPRVEPASGDASFRRYFRVHLQGGTRILMDAPPPREDCRPFVHVTDLLAAAGVHVPDIVAADVERGFLLLSDLGDRLYLDELCDDTADALYTDAIASLLRLQTRGDATTVPAYDTTLLLGEMQLFPDWFLGRHLGITLDEGARETLRRAFGFLVKVCQEQPQVLVHRDYHSRNLMLVAGNNPGVLDYQDAVRGPITYDLVSLLRDVYVRWPQARVHGWMATWHRGAREAGLDEGADLDTVERWFDLTGVQRHLKVAGIFARLWYRDGKPRYLADIPLTLDYLLSVARRHRELNGLTGLLDELDVVRRNQEAGRALRRQASAP